jgi:hypothetical protein
MAKDKNQVREELEQLRESNGGHTLQPEQVVEFARRNRRSALHAEFEWDDTAAAHQFRLEQARHIIRLSINVLRTPNGDVTVPMYVSLVSDRTAGGGYRTLESVMNDEELRDQLLQQALEEFNRVRRKYQTLQELAPVNRAIDQVARRSARGRAAHT